MLFIVSSLRVSVVWANACHLYGLMRDLYGETGILAPHCIAWLGPRLPSTVAARIQRAYSFNFQLQIPSYTHVDIHPSGRLIPLGAAA